MPQGFTAYTRDFFYPDYVFSASNVLGGHSGHADYYKFSRYEVFGDKNVRKDWADNIRSP